MSSQSITAKVALPYAEALLESVKEANLLQKTNEDLSLISQALLDSSDLKYFLENPLININTKKNVLNELLVDQINSSVLNFLLVLIDRRRISLLSLIIKKYLELAYKLDSIILVEVSTVIALTQEQQEALIEKIKKITNSNSVKLSIIIDSSLIGGLIIQIGSKVIDNSLSGKLKQISYYLNTN